MRYEFRLVDIGAIHQQEDGALSFNPEERIANGRLPPMARHRLPAVMGVVAAAVVARRGRALHHHLWQHTGCRNLAERHCSRATDEAASEVEATRRSTPTRIPNSSVGQRGRVHAASGRIHCRGIT